MQTQTLPVFPLPRIAPHPRTGDRVTFARGGELGCVQQTEPGRFQVAAGDVLLWLRADAVVARSAGVIRLACEPSELYRYTASRRPLATSAARSRPPATLV